jgi:hypothetical protein
MECASASCGNDKCVEYSSVLILLFAYMALIERIWSPSRLTSWWTMLQRSSHDLPKMARTAHENVAVDGKI